MNRAARSGFSVVETVAILVIIAILLLIAIPQFSRPSLAAVAAPDSVVAPGAFGTLAVKVANSRGTPQQGVTVRFEAEGKGREAVRTYTSAAQAGNCEAAKRLGQIYDKGIRDVNRDYVASLKWYSQAEKLGCRVQRAGPRGAA